MKTIRFELNKDEAQDFLNALRCAQSEGEEHESTNCMIETLNGFLKQ